MTVSCFSEEYWVYRDGKLIGRFAKYNEAVALVDGPEYEIEEVVTREDYPF